MSEQTDMFPGQPPTLSPRLKWIEQHKLMLVPCEADLEDNPDGWLCGYRDDFEDARFTERFKDMGFGETELEAEISFCEKNEVKHYTLGQ